MTVYRIPQAAELLGVSQDTLRRWIHSGTLTAVTDELGRQSVDGAELAALAQTRAAPSPRTSGNPSSARNHAIGLVTGILTDKVMAQVTMQCGPYRFVSLMSREAVEDLDLHIGDTATVVVKATNVIVEKPELI
ncbi:MAG: helix-turn-helix domain-containing protein [Ancrocorticia sp.]|jgi:molybdopterin-binding protein|nr:helix-turn-helix domain-containing protein [Ancrocorticia sp.]MCI1896603.1 helix-turn-helix domain-containing protein [Ancrocorticia sp.]MCI1933223.1 helix-turn-helix domain-containing protein [Ancrocorticia sp.]MCI1964392.1 helix-turn-helix domain-containing protein [Ancrocorticia sp.]MCI2002995.1 helix-turn-helix domain-containing protein [Ancrocorticia sp.]